MVFDSCEISLLLPQMVSGQETQRDMISCQISPHLGMDSHEHGRKIPRENPCSVTPSTDGILLASQVFLSAAFGFRHHSLNLILYQLIFTELFCDENAFCDAF